MLGYLGPADVVTAAALVILTTPAPGHRLTARGVILSALDLHRPSEAWVAAAACTLITARFGLKVEAVERIAWPW